MELALDLQLTAAAAAHPSNSRSLHLVDIENLLGGTSFSEGDVALAAERYTAVAEIGPADLVIVASSHHTAYPTWFGWPTARRLVRSGPDGADLALLGVIQNERVEERFDRIVIASGDGIFAFAAAELQAGGVDVTVVCQPEFLSRRLRLAARDIRFIDLVPDPRPLAQVRRIV